MKKVISITLALIMALSLSVTAFAATITAETPSTDNSGVYQIGTAEELYWFANRVNGGYTSINAVLTADIVVNENVLNESGALNSGDFANWTPIGDSSNKYAGTFDGQGHTISGLYYNSIINYVGLFGYIDDGGKISNVGVIDSYIYGNLYVGGVCGYSPYGTITDCYNTGTVSGKNYVGGVCGYSGGETNATITACYNAGVVSGTNDYIGGVCGYSPYGTITDCYNTGTVSGMYYVSGVCGFSTDGTITGCYNTGAVNGTGNYVSGMCGYIRNKTTITDCYNTGVVSGAIKVGGMCGYNSSGAIADCYNTGTINGSRYDIGGVCGNNGSGAITGCYNSGDVSGTGYNIGGVCGYNFNGTITGCYNSGNVSGTESNIGGVCGCNYDSSGTIEYCYTNSGEVYGTNSGIVTECAVFSDEEFADGTALNLLNTALMNAGSDVRFYQVANIDPYPVLTDNRSAEVEYSVAPTYTVTIPETVVLGETATVKADNVVLEKGKYVKVALTGTSGESNAFTVTSEEGAVLEYTVNDGDVKVGSTVLTVDPTNGNSGSKTLSFSEPAEKKFSGSYTGTVTFTVSVG